MGRLAIFKALGLAGLLVSAMVLCPVTEGGTFALLEDTVPSTANLAQVDSFDGKLSEVGPATQNSTTDETAVDTAEQTWADYSHHNGSTDEVNNTLRIANPDATNDIDYVNLSVSYSQNDTGVNEIIDDSTATAQSMNITEFTYNGTDLIASHISDANGNNVIDLDDAAAADLSHLDGIPTGENVTLTIAIAGDATNNDNIAGGDGIDFEITVTLVVNPSWRDADTTTKNTIQYVE